MNKKTIYGIALGIAVSVTAIFGDEDAAALRTEIDALNQRLDALEKENDSSGESGWTDKIKIKGDIRARFEHAEIDSDTSKSRFRGRARVGVFADVNDQVYAGVRIATGSDESPTSTNQSLEDFANKRAIWLDLMYMGYTPEAVKGLDLILGKIKQPWEQVSDLMYDSDVNPEGLNAGYGKKFDAFELIANLGYYTWQDKANGNPSSDVTMGAAQLAGKIGMGDHLDLTAGANAFIYHNVAGSEIPTDDKDRFLSKGNTTNTTTGAWAYDYELLEGFAKLDIKNDLVPLKIYGDYIVNMAADVEEDTAWLVGAGAKYKKFGFDYNYREIDADAVIGVLADADFGGTDCKGHKFKLKYTLLKNWTAGLTYFLTERGGSDINILQADLIVKF